MRQGIFYVRFFYERKAGAVERYRKKDMLQMADTLLHANDAIAKTVRSNPQGAAEALAQCQESAIALGTYIDTLGEKHANLVHILEEYCENIYQMSESLSDENACRKVSKKIQKQLTGLKNGIKYDLPEDRKEIVFLPYKASMWDSLESVWKAADADPGCDAYVIPIPYFDKNPDGSFREEHYEGDQYPAYVPVTRYDAYDLEARRPDEIYIHNPYDECNHVTSVHPYFYAKNLRNFTDKLVYIPYFILSEIDPGNQSAIDGMKHFCFTPGTIFAHQVIVQSENMRQIYINEYIKAAKEMELPGEHVDRKFLEKKFLGTGSPKIDKVLNTKREDLEIPAEWLKVIEKPDGSWKKIVFYNTSVSALLQHSEKMLRKMESVFGIFKENRDEVALLWRPHPLIRATIESMRPELWQGYQEIRDRYVAEGWGIYDDSADMDRAVVLSDAYYGDGSSVRWLFQKVGKKVLLQNPNMRNDNGYSLAAAEAIAEADGAYWYVPIWHNGLYRLDMRSGESKWVEKVGENGEMLELYVNACSHKDSLFFIPHKAKKIAVYDIKSKKISSHAFLQKNDEEHPPVRAWFISKIVDKNMLYLLPYFYHSIVCFNMDTKEMRHITLVEADKYDYSKGLCSYGGGLHDGVIYMPSEKDGRVYAIELSTERIGTLPIKNKKYTSLFVVKNQLWMIPFDAAETIDIYDLKKEEIVFTVAFPKEIQEYAKLLKPMGKRCFQKGIRKGDEIYLLACSEKSSVVIDTSANFVEEWRLPQDKDETHIEGGTEHWSRVFELDGRICVINGFTGEWVMETDDGKWESMKKPVKRDLSVDCTEPCAFECPGAVKGTDVTDFW